MPAGSSRPGALLNHGDVDLRLLGRDVAVPRARSEFTRQVRGILAPTRRATPRPCST